VEIRHETERELGNDHYALHHWDAAILHYTKALDSHGVDATLWSNRSACYLQKSWFAQALHDAERSVALRPDWHKGWSRKAAALLGLRRYAEAEAAYKEALRYAPDEEVPRLQSRLKEVQVQQHKGAVGGSKVSASTSSGSQIQNALPRVVHPEPAIMRSRNIVELNIPATLTRPTQHDQHQPPTQSAPSSVSTGRGFSLHSILQQVQTQQQRVESEFVRLRDLLAELELAIKGGDGRTPAVEANNTGGEAMHGVATCAANLDPARTDQTIAAHLDFEDNSQGPAHHGAARDDYIDAVDATDASTHSSGDGAATRGATECGEIDNSCIELNAREVTDDRATRVSEGFKSEHVGEDDPGRGSAACSTDSNNYVDVAAVQQPIVDVDPTSSIAAECGPQASSWGSDDYCALPSHCCSSGGSSEAFLDDNTHDSPPPTGDRTTEQHAFTERRSMRTFSSEFAIAGSTTPSVTSTIASLSTDEEPELLQEERESEEDDVASLSSSEADSDWMAAVEAARKKLGAVGPSGFVPPPTLPRHRANTVKQQHQDPGAPPSRLSFKNLQSVFTAAAAQRRRRDPGGVARVACKKCGVARCSQYLRPDSGADMSPTLGVGFSVAFGFEPTTMHSRQRREERQRACATCECDCAVHETEKEAIDRQTRAQREEQYRKRALNRPAIATPLPSDRERRIASTVSRRAAAGAANEPLQSTNCDMMNQAQRGACQDCKDCPGFCILYRVQDASDPDVMLFCSLCGCRAESHAIDEAWKMQEERRKTEEAAAAARAAAARAASSSATLAARQKEAEAYATLGVHYGADSKAVARAYRNLCRELHPDKQHGKQEKDVEAARERFHTIQCAYTLLTCNGRGAR
jgi:hypothetical protein